MPPCARLSDSAVDLIARWSVALAQASRAPRCALRCPGARRRKQGRHRRRAPMAIDWISASASTLCSASARASRSSTACSKPACSMRRDFVVGEPVGGLHLDRGAHAARLLPRRYRQQAIGIDLERDLDARRPGHHRRDAAQLESRQRPAIRDQLALALHDVQAHRRLAVLEGGELLRARHGNRGIARDDLLCQAAHRLQP